MTPAMLLLGALLLWNLFVFILFGVDKRKAIKNHWRIPERTLLLCAFFGGGVGALLGMEVFHHKTQHTAFRFLVPVCFVLLVAFSAWALAGFPGILC